MPGLLRGVARTAVVAGTATAVSNRVSRRQAGRWASQDQQQYEQQQYEQQQQAAPPAVPAQAVYAAPPAADDMSSKLEQLQQLGELKEQGVLTDAEFEVQKSRILNS
jgi:Short C-terminal domain